MTRLARLFLFVLAAPVMLSGCATYNMTKPAPAQAQPIAIAISSEGPSGWSDLPIGAYRVPKTNVIISGHQSGGSAGAMFGVIGILTQDAIETGTGARAVKSAEDALRVDLVPQTQAVTQKMLASERFAQAFTLSAAEKGPALTVVPYLVVTFASDTEARPYVVLKTTLKQAGGADWVTRYSASIGKPLPLAGENSLTADGGKILGEQLAHDVESAVGAMLDDVMTRHVRDENKMLYVESRYPYLRQRIAGPGYQLGENDSEIVFLPKFPDATVMAGIHVLDKSQIVYRPATKDDKPKLLEDGQ